MNDTNKHGGSLIAVKNTFACEKLTVDLPDSCVSCKIDISGQELIFCVFYNPPKSSPYRYLSEDFNKILNAFPTSSSLIVCGDINFPETNWPSLTSASEEEQEVVDAFDTKLFRQTVNFSTCGKNLLDVAFHRNCLVHAQRDEFFDKQYDCSDHQSINLNVEIEHQEAKPVIDKYRSFGKADFEGINNAMADKVFNPICYTNIDKTCQELYDYFENLLEIYMPRRTAHRQQLPSWITQSTSNLMKKLNTQKNYSFRNQQATANVELH